MTMTESPPTEAAHSPAAPNAAAAGLYSWLTTSDHKVIGRIWLHSAMLMLLLAAGLGVAVSAERLDPESVDVFGGVNGYVQMWSLYRFGLVLLVAAPLFIGLATSVVPMQVGSTNIAFPRAALAAAWSYVIGASITVISVLSGGGWGAVDGVSAGEADAIALTLLGTGMVLVSIVLGAVCVATTVISLRTAGMGLAKVPLFAWSMLVASAVWVLTLPIAIANLAIIYVDLRGGPLLYGNPEGSTDIYQQLSWLLEQPQVYAVAVPVLGVVGSVVSVVAQRRQVSHAGLMILIGLSGLLAIGGWTQPFFSGEQRSEFVFVAFGLLALVPVVASLGGNSATLASGEAPVGIPPAHLVGSLAAGLLFLAATMAGAVRVIEPLDLIDATATTADTAVLNLAAIAAIVGALAGWWFWSPKTNGSIFSGTQGLAAFTLLLIGGLAIGAGELVAGLAGAQDVMLADPDDSLIEAMVSVSFVGSLALGLGALIVVGIVATSNRGSSVSDDPWGGQTLEWATSSPPLAGNFAAPPARVRSEAPLLDEPEAETIDGDGGES